MLNSSISDTDKKVEAESAGLKLSPEAKEARRKYLQEWRHKNPKKIRKYEKRYWEKRAAMEKTKVGSD